MIFMYSDNCIIDKDISVETLIILVTGRKRCHSSDNVHDKIIKRTRIDSVQGDMVKRGNYILHIYSSYVYVSCIMALV